MQYIMGMRVYYSRDPSREHKMILAHGGGNKLESVLTTIKKMLGIAADYTHFDSDIIVHINSVLMTLNQLGIGPETPASIGSDMDTWDKILGDITNLEAVKTYIYLKVRLLFDPPTSSFVVDSMNRQASELEWRLNVQAETNKEE